MPNFRPNVAALLLNREEKLLVCERRTVEGAWQFPQGGVDEGESDLEALHREVLEETGLAPERYEVVESRDGYRYLFPPWVKKTKKGKKAGFDGQSQTYFLCRLKDDEALRAIELDGREFRDHKWVKPAEFKVDWLPEFKLEVYRQVMKDFFGVKI